MKTETMNKELFFIPTEFGKLASCLFGPTKAPKSLIIAAHGFDPSATMSEHARLMPEFADECVKQDIALLIFDFRGHGLSDSSFDKMSPNTRIDDLKNVMQWAHENYSATPVFLHGFSMGGATAIHTTPSVEKQITGLITWCTVPSYDIDAPSCTWHAKQTDVTSSETIGQCFIDQRPEKSLLDVYREISIPKLQVQGTDDLPHFLEEFKPLFDAAKQPIKHHIIHDADHCFVKREHRQEAFNVTLNWVNDILEA